MLAKCTGFTLLGLAGEVVEVEVDTNNGLPAFDIVGLPDAAVKESKERVRSAIKNSGKKFPNHKITVNLAPADLKKEGAGLDLPIALGIIKASGQLGDSDLTDTVMIGELSLDGSIRGVTGVLPMLISAREKGFKKAVIPFENSKEGEYISGVEVKTAKNLKELCAYIEGVGQITEVSKTDYNVIAENTKYNDDISYVKGQYVAKRAMEVAVSGNHNIIMVGPPGAGKTMLAKCIPSIMPDMSFEDALETTKIHSAAGKLSSEEGIVYRRPYVTPHHTASSVSIIGGGTSAKPGIISLAHNGVLYLDEMAEYPRSVLESLRQPLEDRVITVSRAKATVKYPASFMVVGSMNPCPCGYFGTKQGECKCSFSQISKYKAKVSGPLMDRMDIRITVDSVKYAELTEKTVGESSEEVRKRVNRTRLIQRERFKNDDINTNAEMGERHINLYCKLSKECEEVMELAFNSLNMSARARSRIIKVARTIADMELSENIEPKHLLEAIGYRSEEI
ncbi:MAG: ATP-binding protein [Clostridiales bacterium]|nr:ATP-binding protein [Clostridiales bacterium]